MGGDVLADDEEGGPGLVLGEVLEQRSGLGSRSAVVEGQRDALHLGAVRRVLARVRLRGNGRGGGVGGTEVEFVVRVGGLVPGAAAEVGQPRGDGRFGEHDGDAAGRRDTHRAPVEVHLQIAVGVEGHVVQVGVAALLVAERHVDGLRSDPLPLLQVRDEGVPGVVGDESEGRLPL
ncbi:hypothetical protein [Streptomyces sp. NPDC093591]|uniref:hypothetical protein n=1 Tax=Streptomyces sp. NPDC093591 TaxID=3366044 RepID=UPI0037FAF911